MASRSVAEHEIAGLAVDALKRITSQHGLGVADVSLLVRQRGMCDDDGALAEGAETTKMGGEKGIAQRRQLAQLWTVLEATHATLRADSRCTQRELWYRLKTTGLFSGPPQVNERVLDACAVVSHRSGTAVLREGLGVIAAPRGSMTGCITLLPPDGAPAQPLDTSVFQVPGSTEAIRALRFAADSRARCVLVVEKDSVFRRLIADGLLARFPCVLITASGYPDLATRALVGRVVDALRVRCFALTDYNPHGLALMLAYKHGTANLGLESGCCCPSLQWLGLRAAHVTQRGGGERQSAAASTGYPDDDDYCSGDDNFDYEHAHDGVDGIYADGGDAAARGLPADVFQPMTSRDKSLLTGLLQRAEVASNAGLVREAEAMRKKQVKVEIEALYTFGFDYLSRFVEERILHFDAEREAEAEADRGGGRGGGVGTPRTVPRRQGWDGPRHAEWADDDDYDEESFPGEESASVGEHHLERRDIAFVAERGCSSTRTSAGMGESMDDDDDRFLLDEPPDW